MGKISQSGTLPTEQRREIFSHLLGELSYVEFDLNGANFFLSRSEAGYFMKLTQAVRREVSGFEYNSNGKLLSAFAHGEGEEGDLDQGHKLPTPKVLEGDEILREAYKKSREGAKFLKALSLDSNSLDGLTEEQKILVGKFADRTLPLESAAILIGVHPKDLEEQAQLLGMKKSRRSGNMALGVDRVLQLLPEIISNEDEARVRTTCKLLTKRVHDLNRVAVDTIVTAFDTLIAVAPELFSESALRNVSLEVEEPQSKLYHELSSGVSGSQITRGVLISAGFLSKALKTLSIRTRDWNQS